MSEEHEAQPPARRRRARHAKHRHPLLRVVTWTVAALILVLIVATTYAAWTLNRNVNRVDVTTVIGTDRPTPSVQAKAATGPLNILVLGSDTRLGAGNDAYGDDAQAGGNHSDTSILIHLSGDRKSIMAVSIPRDSMVPAPGDCSPNTPRENWFVRMWNQNFPIGGAGCTIRALEGNTGIFIHHYAVVDFAGFQGMVDALGGVEVCTNVPINDAASDLYLTAGRHVLSGSDALGYVRVRKIGDGSDLSRIKRQQAFMSSVAQKALSSSTILRPDKLYGFLSAATKSLTTDPEFGLGTMNDVAQSLKDVGTSNIQFITVPVEDYPPDPNRVQWSADARAVWDAIRFDTPIGGKPSPSPSPSTTDGPTSTPTEKPLSVSPDQISLRVLNGANVPMLATETGRILRAQGFNQIVLGDAPIISGTRIEYASKNAEAARTVAAAFPGATLVPDESLGTIVQVTVGVGSADVVAVPNRIGTEPLPTQTISAKDAQLPISTPTPSISARTADQDICS